MGPEEVIAFTSHKYRHNYLPSGPEFGLVGLIFDKYLLSLGYIQKSATEGVAYLQACSEYLSEKQH